MKINPLIFVATFVCAFAHGVADAVTIKKAPSVKKQESASAEQNVASMVPAVLGIVNTVRDLTDKTRALDTECVPTTQEISFVNSTMQEWARAARASAKDVESKLGREPCVFSWAEEKRTALGTGSGKECYERFTGADEYQIWGGYPKVSMAKLCSDGTTTCPDKQKRTFSDIYEIFDIIDFDINDYNETEGAVYTKLLAKKEKCMPEKLNAEKKKLWGSKIIETMGGLGVSTNTADIMEAVQSMGGGSNMNALMEVASQYLMPK